MKIKVAKNNLLCGIQIVQSAVSSKVTLPILSNILLDAKDNKLKLNATDLDLGISCEIPVEIVEEGGITIPAKKFSDIVREFPDGEIVIWAKKNQQIDIEGGNCRFKLNGLPKEEFPKFPEFKDKEAVLIEQKILKEMLRLTSFAISYEESRYVLNGALFEISDENIRIVATDGRRLAKIDNKLAKPIKKDISVIIPLKAIQEILRNLKDEGMVSLVIGTNQVLFDINGILIVTRIVDGEYPNYNQVIPPVVEKRVKVKRENFLSSIKRATLLLTLDFQVVKFEIFTDKMVLSKTTPDLGESREEIPVEYGGGELIVGFNPQLFIDFLKNINDDEINIEFKGTQDPAVIRLGDYLYLTSPMRL